MRQAVGFLLLISSFRVISQISKMIKIRGCVARKAIKTPKQINSFLEPVSEKQRNSSSTFVPSAAGSRQRRGHSSGGECPVLCKPEAQ